MGTISTMGNASIVLIQNAKSATKIDIVQNVNLAITQIKAAAINAVITVKSVEEACSVHHVNQDTN